MAMKKYSFDAPEHIMDAIDYRGTVDGSGRASTIWRVMARYLEIINRSKLALAEQFTDAECGLILDACNGVMLSDTMSVQLLPYGVADAIGLDGIDKKWGVDGQVLMDKLNGTSYADRMAIADSIQIWWYRQGHGDAPAYGDLFKRAEVDEDTSLVI